MPGTLLESKPIMSWPKRKLPFWTICVVGGHVTPKNNINIYILNNSCRKTKDGARWAGARKVAKDVPGL